MSTLHSILLHVLIPCLFADCLLGVIIWAMLLAMIIFVVLGVAYSVIIIKML